ncbi:transcriptional regulator [Enterococcus sp. N249-2]
MEITQNQAIEKFLSEVISKEAAKELANIEGQNLTDVYNSLYEQMECQGLVPEEPTVNSVVKSLKELATAEIEGNLTLNEYQDILSREIDLLTLILGID